MKRVLLNAIAVLALLTGVAMAQSGPVNTVTVNPRQNADLTNSTGTETGQPSDMVPHSDSMPNGLNPVTSNMSGNPTNANTIHPGVETKPNSEGNSPATPEESGVNQKKTHETGRK